MIDELNSDASQMRRFTGLKIDPILAVEVDLARGMVDLSYRGFEDYIAMIYIAL